MHWFYYFQKTSSKKNKKDIAIIYLARKHSNMKERRDLVITQCLKTQEREINYRYDNEQIVSETQEYEITKQYKNDLIFFKKHL